MKSVLYVIACGLALGVAYCVGEHLIREAFVCLGGEALTVTAALVRFK